MSAHHIAFEHRRDPSSMVVTCAPCRFEVLLWERTTWDELQAAVNEHIATPPACGDIVDSGEFADGAFRLRCQLGPEHDERHRFEIGSFVAEWS